MIAEEMETLAAIRKEWTNHLGLIDGDMDALLSAVEGVLTLHVPVDIEPSDTICRECSWQLPNGHYFGQIVEYPCPTVRALTDALGVSE